MRAFYEHLSAMSPLGFARFQAALPSMFLFVIPPSPSIGPVSFQERYSPSACRSLHRAKLFLYLLLVSPRPLAATGSKDMEGLPMRRHLYHQPHRPLHGRMKVIEPEIVRSGPLRSALLRTKPASLPSHSSRPVWFPRPQLSPLFWSRLSSVRQTCRFFFFPRR